MNETKVFGDGDNLFIFFKQGVRETVYTLRYPLITEINIEQPSDDFGTGNLLGTPTLINLERETPPLNITIEFKVRAKLPNGEWGYKIESSDEGGLMKGLDLFKNITVSQLFRAIHKKLNKRSAKHRRK